MFNLFLDAINFTTLGIAVAIVAVIAIVFAVLIVAVSKLCAVKEDERVTQIKDLLSGANCGGCGFNGCADFALALKDGKAEICACAATSSENKKEIAKILGVDAGDDTPKMAIIRCAGIDSKKKFDYVGDVSCRKQMAFGGSTACAYACLGGGDCVKSCTFGAGKYNDEVSIDSAICGGCGSCVRTCPKGIVALIPKSAKYYVACSNQDKGKVVMDACAVGCIGCGLCAKKCPTGAISMVNNLPVIDYQKCVSCGACAVACPRKTIREV